MDAFVVIDVSLLERRNKILNKYKNIVDKIVVNIKKKIWNDVKKRNIVLAKLRQFRQKYKNNFKIYVIIDEIINRL